jgi:hypothetical protein
VSKASHRSRRCETESGFSNTVDKLRMSIPGSDRAKVPPDNDACAQKQVPARRECGRGGRACVNGARQRPAMGQLCWRVPTQSEGVNKPKRRPSQTTNRVLRPREDRFGGPASDVPNPKIQKDPYPQSPPFTSRRRTTNENNKTQGNRADLGMSCHRGAAWMQGSVPSMTPHPC